MNYSEKYALKAEENLATEYKNLNARARVSHVQKSISPEKLAEAAKDTSRLVRVAVAKNFRTSPSVLENFWHNEKTSSITEALAGNSSTPVYILEIFCSDARKQIWRKAFNNRSTPFSAIVEATRKTGDPTRAVVVRDMLFKKPDGISVAFNCLLEAGWVTDINTFRGLPDNVIYTYFYEWLTDVTETS